MHRLLERQLKKSLGRTEGFPDDVQRLLNMVGEAYAQCDDDRAQIERSMELSSRELLDRNRELGLAERKYRAIFENATEGIFQSTPTGQFISVNPALARICGYENADALVRAISDIRSQLYVDPARHQEAVAKIGAEGSLAQHESQWRRRDGAIIWVSETVFAIHDSAGNLAYYEGTVSDITARKKAETEREDLQNRLLAISRQAGMAEVATGVLHNVGNVLNSVNVSATVVADKLRQSEIASLTKVGQIIRENETDIASYLTTDERGKLLPGFVADLADCLQQEHEQMLTELSTLSKGIEHIKEVITAQQSFGKVSTVLSPTSPTELFESAMTMQGGSLERHQIELVRQFESVEKVELDKHKVLQILINLIANAKQAVKLANINAPKIVLAIKTVEGETRRLRFQVIDNGMGISAENQTRIFAHGFTTKKGGHGFGLHAAANSAREMGGSLTASSEGPMKGATFTLELPVNSICPEETCKT